MKRLKFPAFLLVMMIALVSAFAFNTAPKKEKLLNTYVYGSSFPQTLSDLKNPAHWSSGSPCITSGNKVCSIDYDGDEAAFDTYISSSTFMSVQDVKDVTDGFRQ